MFEYFSSQFNCEEQLLAFRIRHTGLCDFAERYVRAMEHRIEAERLADGNSVMYLRTLLTDFKIEETFRNVYTDAKFVEVQRELTLRRRRNRLVGGESTRHCINALESQQIPDVPKKYILNRWRKDINRKHTRVKVAHHDLSKTKEVLRYDKMMVAFEPISCLASENDKALRMVIDGLQQFEIQIKKLVKPALPMSSVGEALTNSTPHSVNNAPQFCTPSSVGRSVVCSEDTVGNHILLGQDGVAIECVDVSEPLCFDGVLHEDDFIKRNGVQWG
uniref:Protein FAR1-RELATED SEQUENCE n=1 Tax=Chenopodium quinoa TaxID=63459 RepID=A0A803NCQ3_CHEQI